jgi:type VI secretion system protein ImpC
MRDNIGSSADAPYIQGVLDGWMFKYVTTIVNPDDLTLRYYPFKAASVEVVERPGMIGWYDCKISVLPHIQFEGMDVELRLDARL